MLIIRNKKFRFIFTGKRSRCLRSNAIKGIEPGRGKGKEGGCLHKGHLFWFFCLLSRLDLAKWLV